MHKSQWHSPLYGLACVAIALWATAGLAGEKTSPGCVSVVFAGDVMLDGGPGHLVEHGGDPFAEFSESLSGADLAVCNLECVLAPGGKQVLKPYYPGDPAVWTGWLVKLTFHLDGPVDLETTSFEMDKAGIPRRRPQQP